MKWNAKYTQVNFELGSTRLKRRFAWKPTYIDGKIVWLEDYEILQGYVKNIVTVIIDGKSVDFINYEWINLANRCK